MCQINLVRATFNGLLLKRCSNRLASCWLSPVWTTATLLGMTLLRSSNMTYAVKSALTELRQIVSYDIENGRLTLVTIDSTLSRRNRQH